MTYPALVAIVFVVLSPSWPNLADDALEYRNPAESRGARLVQLIHEFDGHRISDPLDSMLLYAQQSWSFSGDAAVLNRFLQGVAKLRQAQELEIYFTGPEPISGIEPPTVNAAQSAVAYDWRVRILQGKMTIVVPLAANVPFAKVQVPPILGVHAGPGAPRIAEVFAKLHNEQRQQLPEFSNN